MVKTFFHHVIHFFGYPSGIRSWATHNLDKCTCMMIPGCTSFGDSSWLNCSYLCISYTHTTGTHCSRYLIGFCAHLCYGQETIAILAILTNNITGNIYCLFEYRHTAGLLYSAVKKNSYLQWSQMRIGVCIQLGMYFFKLSVKVWTLSRKCCWGSDC